MSLSLIGEQKPQGNKPISPLSGVLDSSAVLAVVFNERGAEEVKPWLEHSCISAVNLAEVVTKLLDEGLTDDLVEAAIGRLSLDIRPFDENQAIQAGLLRRSTRAKGLSLGDRACLALAASLGCPAITADKAWADLDLGITIEVVR